MTFLPAQTIFQSFRRYLKSKHQWFYERYVQRYNTDVAQKKLTNIEDIENQNEIPMQKDDIKEDIESNSSDSSDQKISFTDFDHKKIDSKFFF